MGKEQGWFARVLLGPIEGQEPPVSLEELDRDESDADGGEQRV